MGEPRQIVLESVACFQPASSTELLKIFAVFFFHGT